MSVTVTFVEFFDRIQGEYLDRLKRVRAFHLKNFTSINELASTVPASNGEKARADIPMPVSAVEQAFNITTQIIETQKEYLTKLAELAFVAQRQIAGSAKRVPNRTKSVTKTTKRLDELTERLRQANATRSAVESTTVARF